jgi:hypothetical protein
MVRRLLLAASVVVVASLLVATTGSASTSGPSGQVMYGHTSWDPNTMTFTGGGGTIEPAYDDATGTLVYLQTPNKAQVHPAQKIDPATGMPINVAPLYLVVYPKGSMDPMSLNCAHIPQDNCADHGNLVAGGAEQFAQGVGSTVYSDAGGVAGHDHLVGIASTGGDYNMIWEPVLVVFNNAAAVHHITTLSDLNDSLANNDVSELPLPQLDFNCAGVSAGSYNRGTPAPMVDPNPA